MPFRIDVCKGIEMACILNQIYTVKNVWKIPLRQILREINFFPDQKLEIYPKKFFAKS